MGLALSMPGPRCMVARDKPISPIVMWCHSTIMTGPTAAAIEARWTAAARSGASKTGI